MRLGWSARYNVATVQWLSGRIGLARTQSAPELLVDAETLNVTVSANPSRRRRRGTGVGARKLARERLEALDPGRVIG